MRTLLMTLSLSLFSLTACALDPDPTIDEELEVEADWEKLERPLRDARKTPATEVDYEPGHGIDNYEPGPGIDDALQPCLEDFQCPSLSCDREAHLCRT